jgi:hypothetical protein
MQTIASRYTQDHHQSTIESSKHAAGTVAVMTHASLGPSLFSPGSTSLSISALASNAALYSTPCAGDSDPIVSSEAGANSMLHSKCSQQCFEARACRVSWQVATTFLRRQSKARKVLRHLGAPTKRRCIASAKGSTAFNTACGLTMSSTAHARLPLSDFCLF